MEILKKLARFLLKEEISLLTDRIANRDKALKEMSNRLQHREVKVDLYKTLQEREVLVDDLQVIQRLHINYAAILPKSESNHKKALEIVQQMINKGTDLPMDHEFIAENERLLNEQRWIYETTRRLVNKLEGII